MPLETNFNVSPYYDDFDESKNFHRILFKPATAVQARELTQIQSTLQNQIERFGDHIFTNGSIVDGAGLSFYDKLHYTRLQDHSANGALIDVNMINGALVESTDTGLQGVVLTVKTGTEAAYPDTNRIYVRYVNSGIDGSGNDVKEFLPNETLTFYEGIRSANVQLMVANSYSNTLSNTYTSAIGQGVQCKDGIIYQKGFFIRVSEQTAVVSDTRDAGNTLVGFTTSEFIINSEQDESLLDNALGYTNENAPGADRLKLVPVLTVIDTDDQPDTSDFTPIAEYIAGVPVVKETDATYAKLGDRLAKEKFEESGNYVVKPFTVDTVAHKTDADYLQARISPGIGYTSGHRVELIATTNIDIKRGTDVATASASLITANYGNFILVKELAGPFEFTDLDQIDLYDTAQQALSLRNFGTLTPSGSKIGVASVRCVIPYSGTYGTPDAVYAVFLFDIQMDNGKSFSEVQSIYNNATNKAVADLVSTTIYATDRRAMIWGFGKGAIKRLTDANGNVDTQYIFRTKTTGTMNINGQIPLLLTTSAPGGTNKFPYGAGVVGDGNERRFQVVALANAETVTITTSGATYGNTTATITLGEQAKFSAGEYVKIGANIRRITSVSANATHGVIGIDATIATSSSQTVKKYFPEGYVFPIDDSMVGTRTITITSDTTATITVGLNASANLTATLPVAVYHDVLRYNTVPAKKVINKNVVVKLNVSGSGPWNLGIPDVHKIRKVYGAHANTGADYSTRFYFDTGMRDTHYDHGQLYLRPGYDLPSSNLMVEFDCFTPNTTPGVGFFTVESYPIDDANTANVSAITTSEIPLFKSETGKVHNLRDVVDFRPYKTATATITNNPSLASVNPVASTAYAISTQTHVPSPDTTFQADIQYYLGRKDVIYFTDRGRIKVRTGVPSENPVTPQIPTSSMAITTLTVPPYPSLTSTDVASLSATNRTNRGTIRDISQSVSVEVASHRRYTMEDIGSLDNRISRLEYYTALNMLEKTASDIEVPDSYGLNRFKNGIFVDPFVDHSLGDVSNPEYKISIDSDIGVARPYFNEERTEMTFRAGSSNNIVKTSRLVTLPYTAVKYIDQPYATKYRNAAPLQFHWKGIVELYPSYDHNVDKVNAAAVTVTIDNATQWQDFANSPFGTQYGEWRTVASKTSVSSQTTSQRTTGTVTATGGLTVFNRPLPGTLTGTYTLSGNGTSTTTSTTTTTTSTQKATDLKLSVGTSTTQYNLGNFVTDVSVQPYIRSREIAFHAWSLRPNTTYHAFFDDELVDSYCAPGVRNTSIISTDDDRFVSRTAVWGTALKTNAAGEIFGKFVIPAGQFRVGEREFMLADVTDLTVGADSITSSGAATFIGSNISVLTQSTTLTTINPTFQTSALTKTRTVSTSTTTTNKTYVPDPVLPSSNYNIGNGMYEGGDPKGGRDDSSGGYGGYGGSSDSSNDCPLSQMFRINVDSSIPGIFITDLELYFQKKPDNSNVGLTVYLAEVLNGYPDTSRLIPFGRKRLTWDQINVSNDGSVATKFTFEAPIYLANGKQYAWVTYPDGANPDYLLWMAELGATDVRSGVQVFSKPYVDNAFYSSNQSTWTSLNTEYMKFTMYRANFTAGTGTAVYYNADEEYFTTDNLTLANASMVGVQAGDVVVASTNNLVSTANTAVRGNMWSYNSIDGKMFLNRTTGNWTGKTYLQIHRPATDGGALSNTTLVAHANLVSIDNLRINAIAPRFALIQPPGTTLRFSFKGTNPSGYALDGQYQDVIVETETELYDYERIVASRSNEVTNMAGEKSLQMRVDYASGSSYLSPVLDTIRSHSVVIGNEIDDLSFDLTGEYGSDGTVKTKYVSRPVVLATGQDAEDLLVFVTAYRPQQSNVLVYARFLNAEDPSDITSTTWTPLIIDNNNNYSDYRNVNDYRELMYRLPNQDELTALGAPGTAAYMVDEQGMQYTNEFGVTFIGYRMFAIKIVLLSDNTSRVPRLPDVRAIALQM